MDPIQERSREVGRLLAQTPEYKALKRANDQLADDRETVTLLNRLNDLQEEFATALRSGVEPPQEQQDDFEQLLNQLQGRSGYQALVSAQSNFDRLMMRVNEEIAQGMSAAEQSRIILPS